MKLDLEKLQGVDFVEAEELMCKAHLGVWAERKRGFSNAQLHWEWCDLAMRLRRLAVVAPREHAKSEVFTVNQVTWRCTYTPGLQAFGFAETGDMAKKLKARVDRCVQETAPWMLKGPNVQQNTEYSRYANFSEFRVAGSGAGVRGAHPDLIVGDDVLSEGTCLTHHQRQKLHRWWHGTVGGMAHPGTWRFLGEDEAKAPRVWMPPTRIHLVGTPFHQSDLLMAMRDNQIYRFRRYQAEFDENDLVEGLAVEST